MSSVEEIERAVAQLAAGALVGMPTETVYGLAGDATNAAAVRKIFALKGRPADHPVIVHLHDPEQIKDWARDIPSIAWDLAKAFWPGPLTLILPRHERVLDLVTGGHPTVGLRIPGHPLARSLLEAFGQAHSGALAAPSANRFGRVSPTTAAHVRSEFGQDLAMILDGGPCDVGIESTIVDLSCARPTILRPGHFALPALGALLDEVQGPDSGQTPAPGTLAAHYAVKIPSYAQVDPAAVPRVDGRNGWIGFVEPVPCPGDWQIELLGDDAASFARGFYQALRRLEAAQVQAIYIQALPDSPDWQGVSDRVQRACVAWSNRDPKRHA